MSAHAQDGIAPDAPKPVLVAEVQPGFQVVLEGKPIVTEVSKDARNGVYVRAEPIFKALNDHFEYNVDDGALIVERSQDGVVMELYTQTGIVKANGKALGKLKVFGEVSVGKINLTPNAIAVLSGANGKIDNKTNTINFKLDPRLKVATGFEIFVSGVPLGNIEPGPKAIGSVMLLPLRPIAKALGHEVRVIDGGQTIEIRRAQDSARFTMNLDTGLVKLNDKPVGVAKDVTYIDEANLLIPIRAIETLTGTHIDVEGGNSHINIELDDRLKGAIEPSATILDETENAPFTIEAIEFHTGTDTINSANLDFRVKGMNARVRYEIPDLPTNAKDAEPSWLSMDLAHVNGATGAIGDYAADYRELDGVGLHRIRGIAVQKSGDKGRFAAVVGVPTSGSEKISEDQSRLTFSGAAAGIRYADKKGWEAGLSYKSDGLSDDQMLVLSAISGRLGRKPEKKLNWDTRADVGMFSGEAREKSVDVRAAGNARYDISKNISVDAHASYDGAEFLRNDLDREDTIITPEDEQDTGIIPDIRNRGQDIANIGVSTQIVTRKSIGPLQRPAISARVSQNRTGVFAGQESARKVTNYGVSLNTEIVTLGTNISTEYAGYRETQVDRETEMGEQFIVRADQNTKYVKLQAQYQSSRIGDEAWKQRVNGQISTNPLKLAFPKDAKLSATPSVSASWSEKNSNVRGGIVANFNSGDLLGQKTKLTASAGILQDISGSNEKNSDQFLSVSIGRKLEISKNLSLGLSYRNDLKGAQRVGVFLDGRFGFHAKRKFKKAVDGRGVLKGQAFFDKNRDGIKQDDEPGMGGAMVRVKSTRMALRTDANGYYTIQNIKEGLFELYVDGRSLPLGYSLADNISTKASIRAGHITDIPLPIVHRGQILGFVFVDENQDGQHNKGEARLEGAQLTLRSLIDQSETFKVYASSFGQFAFDDLPGGEYELSIEKTNAPNSQPGTSITINLDAAEDHMARVNIAAIRRERQMANQNAPPLPVAIGREPDPHPDPLNGPKNSGP